MKNTAKYKEGDIIPCIVIETGKTTVFVETLDCAKGSIVFSEIAPGRIRNIRDYVVPNKIIVCKILSIGNEHLFLSLRRVKNKEKNEILDSYKKEKSITSLIKKIHGEKSGDIINKITKKQTIAEFLENAKQNPDLIREYFSEQDSKKIEEIIAQKKEKERKIKRDFSLKSKESDGIIKIKKILSPYETVTYLGGSKFSISITSRDLKKANSELNEIIEQIEKNAKKEKCEFEMRK